MFLPKKKDIFKSVLHLGALSKAWCGWLRNVIWILLKMNFNADIQGFIHETKMKGIKATEKTQRTTQEYKSIDDRARYANFNRGLHTQRIEDDYYDTIVYRMEGEKRHDQKIREDLLLARDIDQQKNEEIKHYKMRQYLRENAPELRELESKLRTAYTTKALLAQQEDNKKRRLLEQEKKRRIDETLYNSINLDADKNAREANAQKQLQYKKELQDQMIQNYQLQQNKYEEFLKEKKYLDYIIQRIYDEDQREMEAKMCKMKQTQEEIRKFKEAQKIFRDRKQKELEEENTRFIVYMQEKEEEERQRIIEKKKKEAVKTEMHEQLCIKLYEDLHEKEERGRILQELNEEEIKQRDIALDQGKIRQEIESKLMLKQELQTQREYKIQKEHQEKLDEIEYSEQMWAKLAEEKKLDQLSNEKRRRKMIEMRHELQEMLEEKRAKRAEEVKYLLWLEEQTKIQQDERRKIIEEERIRMLKQHAQNLIGFFPPGVLRPDDLEHLGADVIKHHTVPCNEIL